MTRAGGLAQSWAPESRIEAGKGSSNGWLVLIVNRIAVSIPTIMSIVLGIVGRVRIMLTPNGVFDELLTPHWEVYNIPYALLCPIS